MSLSHAPFLEKNFPYWTLSPVYANVQQEYCVLEGLFGCNRGHIDSEEQQGTDDESGQMPTTGQMKVELWGHIENVQEIKCCCLPMPTNIPPSGEDVMISLFIISFIFNIRTPNCVLLEKASANNGWWSISRHIYKSIQDRHCWWWYRRNIGGGEKESLILNWGSS